MNLNMKKMRLLFTVFFGIASFVVSAQQQLYDSFDDGDFLDSPAWVGDTASWVVITDSDVAAGAVSSHTLRLQVNTAGTGSTYLSSQPVNWGVSQEWAFFVGRRDQAYTQAARLYLWLYASESDLTSSTVDGYRIMIGDNVGSGDKIFLQYVENGTVQSTIVTSAGAIPNGLTDIGFLLRITRSATGTWEIYTSVLPTSNGEGAVATDVPDMNQTTVFQGNGVHNLLPLVFGGYLGVVAHYSTSLASRTCVEIDQVHFTPQIPTPSSVYIEGLYHNDSLDVASGNEVVLQTIRMSVTGGDVVLNGFTMHTSGSYTASDIDSFAVFYSTDSLLSSGDVVLGVITSGLGSGSHSFLFFAPQVVQNTTTGYLILMAYIANSASHGHYIKLDPISFSDIYFAGSVQMLGNDPIVSGGIRRIVDRVPQPGEILINQFHTGYGSASEEYIELVNRTNRVLDLSKLKLSYQSAGGSNSNAGGNLSGMLQPYAFWLLSTGNNDTISYGQTENILRDGSFNSGFAAQNGQIALIRIVDNVRIDGVAYGNVTTNNFGWGAPSVSPGSSSQQGLKRVVDGFHSYDNATDFTTINNADVWLRNSHSRLASTGDTLPGGNIYSLYITGDAVIGDSLTVNKLLSVTQNSILYTKDKLRLSAHSALDRAYIAPVSGTINGQVQTELYIPKGRCAYRELAPGVHSLTPIFHHWQENGLPLEGYGTLITGSIGTVGSYDPMTGLDYSSSGTHSMYYYEDTAWHAIVSTNQLTDTLSAFRGYRLFIWGDRTVSPDGPIVDTMNVATLLRAAGRVVTGDVVFTTTGVTNGSTLSTNVKLNSCPECYHHVPNPYLAPIDFNALMAQSTGVQDRYWYFDPSIARKGAYIIWDGSMNTGSVIGSKVGNYIQAGQAIFLKSLSNTSVSPVVHFQESQKRLRDASVPVFKTSSNNFWQVSVWEENLNDSKGLDAAVIIFDNQYSASINDEDAIKLFNPDENIGIIWDGQFLGVSRQPEPTSGDSVQIGLWNMLENQAYKIVIHVGASIPSGVQAYFYDHFLGQYSQINSLDTFSYSFMVTQDINSWKDRFWIIFSHQPPLSLSAINLEAVYKNHEVRLIWTVENSESDRVYILEKETGKQPFHPIAEISASTKHRYEYIDYDITENGVCYRVVVKRQWGNINYSNTACVSNTISARSQLKIYPNPLTGNKLCFEIPHRKSESLQLTIYDILGKEIEQRSLFVPANQKEVCIDLILPLTGTYVVKLVTSEEVIFEKFQFHP